MGNIGRTVDLLALASAAKKRGETIDLGKRKDADKNGGGGEERLVLQRSGKKEARVEKKMDHDQDDSDNDGLFDPEALDNAFANLAELEYPPNTPLKGSVKSRRIENKEVSNPSLSDITAALKHLLNLEFASPAPQDTDDDVLASSDEEEDETQDGGGVTQDTFENSSYPP